jgi:molecular chaperone DnaK (HSP70)
MTKKELLIHQIPQIEVEGNTTIPTVLLYESKERVLIGSAAIAAAEHPHDLNCDFKIDLGRTDPSKKSRNLFRTASGENRSAQTLAEDFFREMLKHTARWLSRNGITRGTRILLAEPLSMQSDPEWLANYRKALRQILEKRQFAGIENIEFDKMDFLPEPFAVFQYYRYGYRHPLLAGQKKNQALVIDFGGGTIDACIIETTKGGELSQSGRNSRPLAASSEPVGGFVINQKIVEHLFTNHILRTEKVMLAPGFRDYAGALGVAFVGGSQGAGHGKVHQQIT